MTKPRVAPLLVLSLALLGACDEGAGPNGDLPEGFSVSFGVNRQPAGGPSAALIPITDSTHTIDLQTVELTINRIVLERAGREFDHDDNEAEKDSIGHMRHHDGRHRGDDDDHGRDLRFGAVTVDLPLEGGVITPINAPLPDGAFDEIELTLSHVRARGTFDGEAFDATIFVNSKLEIEFDSVFVADSTNNQLNVTIMVNVDGWFRDRAGNLIDPGLLQIDALLRARVAHQIRASFRAIEDRDRDAREDDDDHDGDRSGSNSGRG